MSAKHYLPAAFVGAVFLAVCLFAAKPTEGCPPDTSYAQLAIHAIDRTDVPWLAPAIEDLDQIRGF